MPQNVVRGGAVEIKVRKHDAQITLDWLGQAYTGAGPTEQESSGRRGTAYMGHFGLRPACSSGRSDKTGGVGRPLLAQSGQTQQVVTTKANDPKQTRRQRAAM